MFNKVQQKQPSLEVDRDKYEVHLMTRASRQLNSEQLKEARERAIRERKARMAKASW